MHLVSFIRKVEEALLTVNGGKALGFQIKFAGGLLNHNAFISLHFFLKQLQ